MSNVTVVEAVERVLKPIQQFTRGWMMTQSTAERGVAVGMRTANDFWICGRAGVIGDGDADVAAAALAFISPDGVRRAWESIPAGTSPRAIAGAYADCCTEWGRSTLAGFDRDRLERLDRLGRKVADAATPALGVLFAGWRAMPIPDDVGARVSLTMHVLRELRGGAHIVAVLASGISPLDAILASTAVAPRRGPEWAEHLYWRGPFRDPEEVREARLEAEGLTSRLLYPAYSVLDPGELADFVELVESTRAAIDM